MNTTTETPIPTEVHIRVAQDDDASRIAAVLEALGYRVMRELDEGDGPQRLEWAVTRLARQHKLTNREQDILALVLDGHDNEGVGRKLSISRATVKWHMHNLFAKTNTGNRESLLRLALQLGSQDGPSAPMPTSRPSSSTSSTSPSQPAPKPAPAKLASAVSVRPAAMVKRDSSWAAGEDVTSRVDFDQPRVPSADSIPSKRWGSF